MDGNVTITGNIGREPESRYTATGSQQLTFSVALYTGKTKEGEYKKSYWANVTLWDGKESRMASDYVDQLHKGQRVTVTGFANEPRTYDNKSLGRTVDAPLSITGRKVEIAPARTEEVADI